MTDHVSPRLFLERRSYQRRRLIDAVRLLPFLGGVLWLVPLIWTDASGDTHAVGVVEASAYIFVVWGGLTGLSALLVSRLPKTDDLLASTENVSDDGAA